MNDASTRSHCLFIIWVDSTQEGSDVWPSEEDMKAESNIENREMFTIDSRDCSKNNFNSKFQPGRTTVKASPRRPSWK